MAEALDERHLLLDTVDVTMLIQPPSRREGSTRPSPWLAAGGAALSALSVVIILYTASEEPFTVFRSSDLVLIVVLGGVVSALFVSFAVACVRGYLRAPRSSARAMVLVCASMLWTAIHLFYLSTSIYGYFQDLTNPNFGPWR